MRSDSPIWPAGWSGWQPRDRSPSTRGSVGRAVADFVCERGGILSRSDMAAYRPIERLPVGASYRGCRILTNPPPSSGGILIAYALELLERAGGEGIEALVGAMGAANEARGEEFSDGLYREGFGADFLSPERLEAPLPELARLIGGGAGERFGSTTHLAVIDAEGVCASVTCSNGTGSGLVVPGTGIHVNNMLGEEDLNPHGFHRTPAGRRIPSMMSPTIVLCDGEVIAGLGSAGSNRIRSAVLQTVVRLLADGMGPADAVAAPRVHFEAGSLQAEPGVDEEGLRRVEAVGVPVVRWRERNLFFGGVQAVTRDPATGEVRGEEIPGEAGPLPMPEIWLDHAILAVPDLEGAGAEIERRFGLTSAPGGSHPAWGTGNRIVPFGSTYLELMAVVDEAAAADSWFGRHVAATVAEGERLLGWVVATDGIDQIGERLGLDVSSGSRARPDGSTLTWRLAGLEHAMASNALPFFIEWDGPTEAHPGAAAAEHRRRPQGIDWIEVSVDEQQLWDWLGPAEAAELPLRVVPGASGLRAVGIATDEGEAVVR